MFETLGLSATEQSVYTALVERSPAAAGELRAEAGVDSRRVADALDALEANGLVTRHPGTPARYSAVDPDIALEALILDREEQLKRTRLAAQQLTARFRASAGRRDPAELIEVVTGPEAVGRRIRQIQRNTRRELRFIDKPPYLQPVEAMLGTEVEQLQRNVRYRGIYDPAGLAEFHGLHGDMETAVAHGEHARMLPNPPVKLLLIDDRYACLPLQADPDEIVSVVIVHPSGLLEALSALFEALWQRALPLALDNAPIPPGPASSRDDRHLIALLTAGTPDSVAAKQLDVSPRTYQRRIQDLMSHLGADTRFQAGLQAALLGWVSRP